MQCDGEKSAIVWFCRPWREKVEKNIIVDQEIEDRCREIMERFENRLKNVEEKVKIGYGAS
jgi:predicted component of type VI protein secretion system